MTHKDILLAYQKTEARKQAERLQNNQKATQDYLDSEEYKRDAHNHYESLWAKKAQREGWDYTPKRYVSEAEKAAQAEQQRQDKIASLKAEIAKLEAQGYVTEIIETD